MNVRMYGTVKKRTNLYVLRSTGNAYDVISQRRLSGLDRAPPNILDKSTPMITSYPRILSRSATSLFLSALSALPIGNDLFLPYVRVTILYGSNQAQFASIGLSLWKRLPALPHSSILRSPLWGRS